MKQDRVEITADVLQEAWSQIESKLAQAEGKTFLQKSLYEGAVGLSAVVRVRDSMPGILLLVNEAVSKDRWASQQYSGVQFDPIVKLEKGFGLPLMLADVKARDIFSLLAADIASLISREEDEKLRLAAMFNGLARWRRFLQRRIAEMSNEEVRGLIGELFILDIATQKFGIDSALDFWGGPRGELHDFAMASFRVEVKTWINDSLPRIIISNPSQIIVDPAYPVWISAIQLSKDKLSGRVLSEWVEMLERRMDQAQQDAFHSLLADYGFLSVHADFYSDRYSVSKVAFYEIDERFPRVDAKSLAPAICWFSYALELNSIAEYEGVSPFSVF